jgi:hypothetical protein
LKELKKRSVSFRVSSRFKWALAAAARRENRSQANFLETLVFEYCQKVGINLDGPSKSEPPQVSPVREQK